MTHLGQQDDDGTDIAAQIGVLTINGDDHQQDPTLPPPQYANIASPPEPNGAPQYPPYGLNQSYGYYAGPNGGGVTVEQNYGPSMLSPATTGYSYSAVPSDLLALSPPQSSPGYQGFPSLANVYGDQNQANKNEYSHIKSPNARQAIETRRDPGIFQQQQQAPGWNNVYHDPRPLWMHTRDRAQQQVQHGTERKRGGTTGWNPPHNIPYTPHANQGSYAAQPISNWRHNQINGKIYPPHSSYGPGHRTWNPYEPTYGVSSWLLRRRWDQPRRSALLEDFRLNKIRKWELKDLTGHIVEFASDQHGSRFIQQKLESPNLEERQKIFDEIMPSAYQLMTDLFGNYVTQKMFEHGTAGQKVALLNAMQGHVLQLSLQTYGCRVVQKALEHVSIEQRNLLIYELKDHIFGCVKSPNANHVVQRLITLGPPAVVVNEFSGHIEELAKHAYGCRVLQKLFENVDQELQKPLLEELHDCALGLMEDQFGNYVVQSVIAVGAEKDQSKLIGLMKGKLNTLSRHKFASNVVEKAIINATPDDRRDLIKELIGAQSNGANQVAMLLWDPFANFPLQTALITAAPDQQQELLDIMAGVLPSIRSLPVGRRLENRIIQLEAEGIFATHRKALSVSTATTSTSATRNGSHPTSSALSRSTTASTAPVSPEPPMIKRANTSTPRFWSRAGSAKSGKSVVLSDGTGVQRVLH
ncbi:hypothetical protein IAU60_002358 [Kwoniella sp. DSM 27419]